MGNTLWPPGRSNVKRAMEEIFCSGLSAFRDPARGRREYGLAVPRDRLLRETGGIGQNTAGGAPSAWSRSPCHRGKANRAHRIDPVWRGARFPSLEWTGKV